MENRLGETCTKQQRNGNKESFSYYLLRNHLSLPIRLALGKVSFCSAISFGFWCFALQYQYQYEVTTALGGTYCQNKNEIVLIYIFWCLASQQWTLNAYMLPSQYFRRSKPNFYGFSQVKRSIGETWIELVLLLDRITKQ